MNTPADAPDHWLLTDTAIFSNFVLPDPLHGDNGLPTSPAIDPEKYGPVNVPLDTDGNALPGPVEGSIEYFEATYYNLRTIPSPTSPLTRLNRLCADSPPS